MALDVQFGELRSLLNDEVSKSKMCHLVSLVLDSEAIDRAEVETAWAPYIEAHLQRWYAQHPWSTGWELSDTGWSIEDPLDVGYALAKRVLQTRSCLLHSLRGLWLSRGACVEEGASRVVGEAWRAGAMARLEWLEVTAPRGEEGAQWADALCERAPRGLRALRWDMSPSALSELGSRLLTAPMVRQLEALSIQGEADTSGAERLLGEVGALRRLTLCAALDFGFIEQLIRAPSCRQLRSLDLSGGWAKEGSGVSLDAQRVSGWGELEGLRQLSLMSYHLTVADIAHLLRWPSVGRLDALKLEGGDTGDAALRMIARHPHTKAVRRLGLGISGVTGEVMEQGAVIEALGRLEGLSLWGNTLSARGVAALARARWPALRALHLGLAELGDTTFGPLCDGLERMPRLEVINLYKNPLGDASIERLMAQLPPTLRELHIGDTLVTDMGARLMADTPAMRRLDYLDIIDTKITDVGVDILKRSPYTSHLMD